MTGSKSLNEIDGAVATARAAMAATKSLRRDLSQFKGYRCSEEIVRLIRDIDERRCLDKVNALLYRRLSVGQQAPKRAAQRPAMPTAHLQRATRGQQEQN